MNRRHAFTLTEVLIALALVSLLLVGVSRIFTMTSQTIGIGQGLSAAMRNQKALQSTFAEDFVGRSMYGESFSGMAPLVVKNGTSPSSPFFAISNFRTSAYANENDWKTAIDSPNAKPTSFNAASHSDTVRTIDNGSGQYRMSFYELGQRNFRTDTIGFFTRGKFVSQTAPGGVESDASFVWYGHLSIFTSDREDLNDIDAYGAPGAWMIRNPLNTSQYRENRNHRFADTFRLGRMQALLVEPQPFIASVSPPNPSGGVYEDFRFHTVTDGAINPVPFIGRDWDSPSDPVSPLGPPAPYAPLSPLSFDSLVYEYRRTGSPPLNEIVYHDGSPNFADTFAVGPDENRTTMRMGRTDILGSGIRPLRVRAEHLDTFTPATWRDYLPTKWSDRVQTNPFPANFGNRELSSTTWQLGTNVSQFIVEFAGDFVTQNENGIPTAPTPDGTVDFVMIDGVRQIRFYGMPRDVNNDGVIAGTGANRFNTPDVIPVRDVAGAVQTFERFVYGTPQANYRALNAVNNSEPGGVNSTPDATSYQCVWGPREFAGVVDVNGVTRYAVPQLIRVITEVADERGRLNEPVRTEMVYPVRVFE